MSSLPEKIAVSQKSRFYPEPRFCPESRIWNAKKKSNSRIKQTHVRNQTPENPSMFATVLAGNNLSALNTMDAMAVDGMAVAPIRVNVLDKRKIERIRMRSSQEIRKIKGESNYFLEDLFRANMMAYMVDNIEFFNVILHVRPDLRKHICYRALINGEVAQTIVNKEGLRVFALEVIPNHHNNIKAIILRDIEHLP